MSMSMTKFFGLIAVSAALCSGCSEAPPSEETANLQQKGGGWAPNGPDLVHGRINGRIFQGVRLLRNRPMYLVDEGGANAITLSNTDYRGKSVTTMPMNQGWFRFTYGQGMMAERYDAQDLTFEFSAIAPGTTTLVPYRLKVGRVGAPSNGSPLYGLHEMTYSFLDSSGWSAPKSFCEDADGNPEPMVPLRGRFWNLTNGNAVLDPDMVSFACLSAAVAGCMEYGYNPWQSQIECLNPSMPGTCHPANMWEIHQVCTRLKRADYCGTGKAHTMSGAMIHPFDWLSPPINSSGPDYFKELEAIWGVNGVTCVNVDNLRHPELVDQDYDCSVKLYKMTPACNPDRLGQSILGDLVEPEKK